MALHALWTGPERLAAWLMLRYKQRLRTEKAGPMKTQVSTHLIHEKDGRHLMIRRAGSAYYPGFLSLVAGHVESPETPLEALLREAAEEIGVRLAPGDVSFAKVLHRRLPDRIYIDYFFKAEHMPDALQICEPDKISEIGMFDLQAVRDQIVPYVWAVLTSPQTYQEFEEGGLMPRL